MKHPATYETKSGEKNNLWLMLKHKATERQIEIIFEAFRKSRIEPILIKGWAASLAYTEPWQRYSSDIDLAVAPDDYEAAVELVKTLKQINIDLHRGLRHLDTVEWSILFGNSKLVKTEHGEIRVLREEDHLRVLAVHWLQDGGAYRHRLADIFYTVKNRPDDFDWNKCLNLVEEKRQLWIIYAIGLAHKYCGLNIDGLPFKETALKIPVWITGTVEKEWKNEVKLIPLDNSLSDPKQLYEQILKRIPPNAIQATIDMNGHFDKYPRIFYQTGSLALRLMPSIGRIYKIVKSKIRT